MQFIAGVVVDPAAQAREIGLDREIVLIEALRAFEQLLQSPQLPPPPQQQQQQQQPPPPPSQQQQLPEREECSSHSAPLVSSAAWLSPAAKFLGGPSAALFEAARA